MEPVVWEEPTSSRKLTMTRLHLMELVLLLRPLMLRGRPQPLLLTMPLRGHWMRLVTVRLRRSMGRHLAARDRQVVLPGQ